MATPILHHYAASLFSEKVRLLLGWKQLPWRSVEIAPVMPRPLLMPLTGGYRRTPVLQIGADIFCDTRVICMELERLAATPVLYPAARRLTAKGLAEWADSHLFRVVVALNFAPAAAAATFGRMPAGVREAFVRDRAELSANSPGIGRIESGLARNWLAQHLADLEVQLAATPFLAGAQPDISDFALYHCLWFLQQNPVNRPLLEGRPVLQAWLGRMAAPGHGSRQEISAEAALAEARDSSPAALVADDSAVPEGLALGQQVAVAATDYGVNAIQGELLACGLDRLAIGRDDPEAGRLVVHFPRLGFAVSAA